MKITINNKEKEFIDLIEISVADLLKRMKYSFPMIVVKVNGQVIKKEDYSAFLVQNNDQVQAIHLIGGG
jgi:thiamine biosynthesis protein ThiS